MKSLLNDTIFMNQYGSSVNGLTARMVSGFLVCSLSCLKNSLQLSSSTELPLILTFSNRSTIWACRVEMNSSSHWLNTNVMASLICLQFLMMLETVLASLVMSSPWAPQFFWLMTMTICSLSTFFRASMVVILLAISTSIPAVSSNPGQSIPQVTQSQSSSSQQIQSSPSSYLGIIKFYGIQQRRGYLVVERLEYPITRFLCSVENEKEVFGCIVKIPLIFIFCIQQPINLVKMVVLPAFERPKNNMTLIFFQISLTFSKCVFQIYRPFQIILNTSCMSIPHTIDFNIFKFLLTSLFYQIFFFAFYNQLLFILGSESMVCLSYSFTFNYLRCSMKYLAYYIYSFLNLYYINVSGIYLMSYYNYLRYSSAFLISIYIVRSSRAGSSDSYIFVIYKLTLQDYYVTTCFFFNYFNFNYLRAYFTQFEATISLINLIFFGVVSYIICSIIYMQGLPLIIQVIRCYKFTFYTPPFLKITLNAFQALDSGDYQGQSSEMTFLSSLDFNMSYNVLS